MGISWSTQAGASQSSASAAARRQHNAPNSAKRQRLNDADDERHGGDSRNHSSQEQPQSPQLEQQQQYQQHNQEQQLVPGLPNEVGLQVLARAPRACHAAMRGVCSAWHILLSRSSSDLFALRREIAASEQWLYLLLKDKQERPLAYALDPASATWHRLPPLPPAPGAAAAGDGGARGLFGALRGLLYGRHVAAPTPFFGCAAAELRGRLLLLGGFSGSAPLTSVWEYDPLVNSWAAVRPMVNGRAYCKAGAVNGKLYVVGGVCKGRYGLTPLRGGEVYDPDEDTWTAIPGMHFRGAGALPVAFVADVLKPIATGMAAVNGKLWVPQSLYSWPFFLDVGGEVFDPLTGDWSDMPRGMGEGWPARQAGMKPSAVVNGSIYSLDPAGPQEGGCKVKVYDFDRDCWLTADCGEVPVALDLSPECESPYLLAPLRTGLHVITKNASDGSVNVLRLSLPQVQSRGNWSTVACRNFGPLELLACTVLEL